MQRIQMILEDDLDGGEASETVSFALDGTRYEIDLNDGNAQGLREALDPYVRVARKMNKRKPHTRTGPDPAEIRKWAREHDMPVPDRGRIPKDIYRAYLAA